MQINKRNNLSAFFLICSLYCFSQNVVVSHDCLLKNSAIISESLINYQGENDVSEMLENGTRFLAYFIVDSTGKVLKIKKVSDRYVKTKINFEKLKCFLIEGGISFNICYEAFPERTSEESTSILKETINRGKENSFIINVGFPGMLMLYYDSIETLSSEKVSKINYLKSQIIKYK